MARFITLCSSSSGNAAFIGTGNYGVLVDAGVSAKRLKDAMSAAGLDPAFIRALFVTHEHSDHIAGVGILARRHHLPVYANEATWQAMAAKVGKLPAEQRRVFLSDEDFYIGQLGVVPFRIPHDAAEPVGFRLWGGQLSVSTATDLGHYTKQVHEAVSGSDLVLLESNHDPDLLLANPHYSERLKRRILGRNGHLSNEACAEALVSLVSTGVKNIILGHLSGENNTPKLALETSQTRAEIEGMVLGEDVCIDLAWRDRVGGVYTLQSGTGW